MTPGVYRLQMVDALEGLTSKRMSVYAEPGAQRCSQDLATLKSGDILTVIHDYEFFESDQYISWWWVPVYFEGKLGWVIGFWSPEKVPHYEKVE